MDEAVARLASGEADFDVFFPTPDVIGKLAAGKLLQPLNKSLPAQPDNVWDSLQDPFYDMGGAYTVPYTLYTTGIGYRDRRGGQGARTTYDNPYDIFWDPANSGQVYLLEDDREVLRHGAAAARAGDRRQHRGPDADRRRARRRRAS